MEAKYKEIETREALAEALKGVRTARRMAFQGLDLSGFGEVERFEDCMFLGCTLTDAQLAGMDGKCLVFPEIDGNDYRIFRGELYSADTLFEGYDPDDPQSFEGCFDTRVYRTYMERGRAASDIKVAMSRSLHDFSIEDALYDFLSHYGEHDIVAVMGGHAMSRCDGMYRKVVEISKTLTEQGKVMVSGGGPGAMEATHLGAWMAGRSTEELEDALGMLSVAPTFRDGQWLQSAFRVMRRYPQGRFRSLGIPTWFYGHEPSTPFATHIAKFFQNSIREEDILAIAKGGVIYSPGSAGTLQEAFQDGAQNHYLTYGCSSPMVFLGSRYYTEEIPLYPFLRSLSDSGRYRNMLLSITDSAAEAVRTVMDFRPEA